MKKNTIKHAAVAAAFALTAISASAQEKVIDGYFRIQTLAGAKSNSNYVEVSGPFTAKPALSYDEAQASAGTVFYLSAVKEEGDRYETPVYRLTNLRSQGIDASLDIVEPADYEQILVDAANAGGSAVHALVRQGFQYGYTSVARATVGTVFMFVASALEKYGVNEDGTAEAKEAYLNVAKNFNEEVVANLDLGIRLMPVDDPAYPDGGVVRLFYDVPDLQMVCDWYLAEDTEEHRIRKATFERAMDAMTKFIEARCNTTLEIFFESDIELMKSWGYDISEKYEIQTLDTGDPEYGVVRYVESSYRTIFSDPDLLFNWIKMVGYYIINPDKDPYDRLTGLGFSDMVSKLHDHYLTSVLADNMHRLRPGLRVFLVNTDGNNLNFASAKTVDSDGDNGKWVITPIDNVKETYNPSDRLLKDSESGMFYTTLYLDFPIKATENVHLYTMTDEQVRTTRVADRDVDLSYITLVELTDEIVPAHTPFILESTVEDASLEIPNDQCVFVKQLATYVPANHEVAETAKTAAMQAPARVVESSRELMGALLQTSATPEAILNYWGIENKPVYTYDSKISYGGNLQPGFNKAVGSIRANDVLYVPDSDRNENFVLIGEPKDTDTTGIGNVAVDNDADVEIYDLNGRHVDEVIPGRIYIVNGKKVFVK